MNLFDLLTNRNKTIDYSKNMPPLEAIQMNNDGSINNNPIAGNEKPVTAYDKLASRTKQAGNNLFSKLFGDVAQPTDYVDTSSGDVINVGISDNLRVGGLIPDIMAGFRENANTPFNVNNFGQNTLDDGRNKGFGYRFGEGLGTAGRFLSSELGRGLLTAGAVGLSGGSGLEALAYGTQAGALNNRLRNEDKIYRNAMIEQAQSSLINNPQFSQLSPEEQQAQLNAVVDNINNMRGYVTQGVYNNMLKAQQMRDNAEWRKLQHEDNVNYRNDMLDLRKDQMSYQKQQDAINNSFKREQIKQGWENVKNNRNKGASFSDVASLRKEFTNLAPVKNATEITRQYNNVNSVWEDYKAGKVSKNALDQALITTLNKVLDPTSVVRESEFDRTSAGQATWDKLEGYAQKLTKGGSGLTDANRQDLINALTTMKNANDKEVANVANDYAELALRYNINPADIMPRHYGKTSNNTVTEGTIINNGKTGQRMIMRGGEWQNL